MAIKTIVGQVASGENFFNRKNEIKILWERIQSGSNIILAAPRRVGKTSLLYHLRDNPSSDYNAIYMITESVNDENEYYKKMFKLVIAELKHFDRFSKYLKHCTQETLGRIEAIFRI